jgi:hypothetical protein
MRKYRTIEVSEAELEDLIRQAPELIEAGLKFVDHQAFTDRGPLDILLVDSGHALVVAELKAVEEDSMLVQGIDYYDYVLRNLDGFCRAYRQHSIHHDQEPRLFLIAPSFSITLLKRIQWISIPISLFAFQCIQVDDAKDETVPIYKEVTAPAIPQRPVVCSLTDRLNYITDPKIRTLATQFLQEMQSFDPQRVLSEPTKFEISVKLSGRVVMYLYPRRKCFLVGTNDSEGKWATFPIHANTDLEAIVPLARANFVRIAGDRMSPSSA